MFKSVMFYVVLGMFFVVLGPIPTEAATECQTVKKKKGLDISSRWPQ